MIGLLLLLLAVPAGQAGRTEREFTVVSEVRLVLLDVGVTDKNGEFVSGLDASAFRVFDNGVERPVTVFAGEDQPVTVGLVIDGSSSMRAKRREVIQAATTLIELSNPEDEVFIVFFGDRVTFGLPESTPFSSGREVLRRGLEAMPPGGRTTLHDGIGAALEHLDRGKHGRHTLVVISDGGDNASATTATELGERLRASRATLHAVGIHDLAQRERAPRFLKTLAGETGGTSFFPDAPAQLDDVARRIAADMRSRYVVGFRPAPAARRERHKLRVRVTAPGSGGWRVRTRKSYLALPVQVKP